MDTRPYLTIPKGTRWTKANLEKYAKLQASGLYNTTAPQPPSFDHSSDKGPGSRFRKRLRNMSDEEKRKLDEAIHNPVPYVPKCECDEADTEYNDLLAGAEKPYKRLKCFLHPENFKRLPSRKKHPVPDQLARLQTAYTVGTEPTPSLTVNPDARIALSEYMDVLHGAGYEMEKTKKGLVYLVNMNDPYGALEKEKGEKCVYACRRDSVI